MESAGKFYQRYFGSSSIAYQPEPRRLLKITDMGNVRGLTNHFVPGVEIFLSRDIQLEELAPLYWRDNGEFFRQLFGDLKTKGYHLTLPEGGYWWTNIGCIQFFSRGTIPENEDYESIFAGLEHCFAIPFHRVVWVKDLQGKLLWHNLSFKLSGEPLVPVETLLNLI